MDLFTSMQAFATTVKMGSMSQAAKVLGVSSAMVGQHIRALENRLGAKLLNRTTRHHSLTDFGMSYLEQCQDILERVSLSEKAAEYQHSHAIGKLRVTAPVTFGSEVLMPALAGYRHIAPDVTLDIILTDRNIDLIEEGVDVAFRIGDLADSSLIGRLLMPYEMVICASPDYLLNKGEPKHPTDLLAHEAIGFTSSSAKPWRMTTQEETIEISVPTPIVVNNGQALRNAAIAGLGIIMQPAILLTKDIHSGSLIPILSDWQLPCRNLFLLYHKDRHIPPRLRYFISYIIETLRSPDYKPAGIKQITGH